MIKTIKFKTPKTPLFDPALAKTFFDTNKTKFFDKILPVIQTGIKLKAPAGATVELKNSIKTRVTGDSGFIFTDLSYAVVVNDGRRAAPVSASADASIAAWIKRSTKGQAFFSNLKSKYKRITIKQAVFLLKRGKKNKKTKGQKFFERGFRSVGAITNRTMKRLLDDVTSGLNA